MLIVEAVILLVKIFWYIMWLIVGYSKDNMKLAQHFKQSGRYEPSAETQAVVNAKYQ